MKYAFILLFLLSLSAYAQPQEVYVNLDQAESRLKLLSSAIDGESVEFSFKINFVNAGNSALRLESLDFLVNGKNGSLISLRRPAIILQHMDSHAVRIVGMRYSKQDRPSFFQFVLRATDSKNQELVRTSKVYID